MSNLQEWIKKQVASGLIIYLNDLKNPARKAEVGKAPKFAIGDSIEFEVMIRNDNSFSLNDLDITIHQVEAVKLQAEPIVVHVQNLDSSEEQKVAAVTGVVRANPDDAKSAWRFLDQICRVTVNGVVDLPPIEFYDEEFEVAHIEDK